MLYGQGVGWLALLCSFQQLAAFQKTNLAGSWQLALPVANKGDQQTEATWAIAGSYIFMRLVVVADIADVWAIRHISGSGTSSSALHAAWRMARCTLSD